MSTTTQDGPFSLLYYVQFSTLIFFIRYGGIIGQGGPSNEEFTSLWTQLASKYGSEQNIIFGVMNEPHDLDINTWADTVQVVVTAIRNAGATSQYILLPGTDYTSAG